MFPNLQLAIQFDLAFELIQQMVLAVMVLQLVFLQMLGHNEPYANKHKKEQQPKAVECKEEELIVILKVEVKMLLIQEVDKY